MRVATVDLDDTLMRTYTDYVEAKQQFADFMKKEYGVSKEETIDEVESVDREALQEEGVNLMESFPLSFQKAIQNLVEEPPEEHVEHADEIARTAYKTREQYAQRGYLDGAREMLSLISHVSDEMHLLTAGVPELQERKIKGLRLNETFDECHIVPMDSKCESLREIRDRGSHENHHVYHIGNSEQSDVKAALRANVKSVYLPEGQWRGTSDMDYEVHDDVHVFDSHHSFNDGMLRKRL